MRLSTLLGSPLNRFALPAALALAFAFSAQAATINVDSSTDDGTGCTLREAVASAETDTPVGGCTGGNDSNDTITFSVATVTLTAGQIAVTEELSIEGPVTITAATGARVFAANGAFAFDLTDVSIQGGEATSGGGVRAVGGVDLSIINGTFSGNRASVSGGAVWIDDMGSLDVNGSTFTGNRARGAASSNGGGAIYTGGAMTDVSNATFTDNRANGAAGSGGAIINPNGATLSVTTSSFDGNRSQRAGGGIETVGGVTTLQSVDFDGNTAGTNPGNGGGIHGGGDVIVSVNFGSASGNRASEGGGYWISADGTLNMTNVFLDGNLASGAASDQGGGGVYVDGGTFFGTGLVFVDNRATGAAGSGGGVLINGGTVTLNDFPIATATGGVNQARGISPGFYQNKANRAGGAIEIVNDAVVNITQLEFQENSAGPSPGNGGAIHTTSGTISLNLTRGSFSRNVAASEGGGVWINPGTTLLADDVGFVENLAQGASSTEGGGGFFNNGGDAAFVGGNFVANRATGASGSGGGAMAVDGTSEFDGTRFFNNFAARAGGAIEVAGPASATVLNGAEIDANMTGRAPGNGGGVHVTGAGFFTIEGSTVTNNTARNEGGGLWNSGDGNMDINRTTVSGNTAPNGGGVFQQLGEVEDAVPLRVLESLIWNNTAQERGGGLALLNGAAIDNSTIYANSARFGGGAFSGSSRVTIDSGTIAENVATTSGGGLSNNDVNNGGDRLVQLRNTIVADNASPGDPNLRGRFGSQGNNVIGTSPGMTTFASEPSDQLGTDPMLEPLADNGGPTWTAALMAGSPAIDAGMTDLTVDQRGVARTEPDDVGAFEFGDAAGMADVLISEFEPNPAGTDPTNVSFEISGEPNTMFSGTVLSIENDGIDGTLDRKTAVSGTFDGNGILVVTIPDLENPSFTVVLSTGAVSANIGDDLDADDDGMIDDTSVLGTVLDAVGVSDATADDGTLYASGLGGTDVLFNGEFEPLNVFRDASTGAFYQTVTVNFGTPEEDIAIFDAAGNELDENDFDMDPTMPTFGSINPSLVAAPNVAAAPTSSLSTATLDELAVSPNPFRGRAQATFAVTDAQTVTVTLYDVMGRQVQQVFSGAVAAGDPVQADVDASALASGVYVLVLQGETVRTARQITVAR